MRQIAFTPDAFKEYNDWVDNPDIIEKIKIFVRDIDREPFRGLGKPEPLKGNWKGYWSRRIRRGHLQCPFFVGRFKICFINRSTFPSEHVEQLSTVVRCVKNKDTAKPHQE